MLSTLMLTFLIKLLLSCWMQTTHLLQAQNQMAVTQSALRVMTYDLHQAVHAQLWWGDLSVVQFDGTSYRYHLNGRGEYVRIRYGGGTAVLATGVSSVLVQINGPIITWQCTNQLGSHWSFTIVYPAGGVWK